MHNINDDIDELMRRAAEDYPLKTDSPDWDKVFSALNTENPPVSSAPEHGKNYRFLSVLLLLFLPLACNYFLGKQNARTALSSTNQQNTSSPAKPAGVKDNKLEPTSLRAVPGQKQHTKDDRQVPPATTTRVKEISSTNANPNSPKQAGLSPVKEMKPSTPVSSGRATGKATGIAVNKSQSQKEIPGSVSTATVPSSAMKNNAAPVNLNGAVGTAAADSTVQAHTRTVPATDTATTQPLTQQSVRQASHKTPAQALYLSVVAGADGSTIKLQSVKAGYNIGVIAGYQFNKKWMVEAGAFWSKKSYYSDAAHIDTSEIYTPPNARLKSIAGDCHMIEIPIDIRYNFHSTERRNWFTALGLSSYIMKKEDYEYSYDKQGWGYDYYKTYKNATTNLLSVAYISVGVQQKIGRTVSLRVEPYLKMPLKGLGIRNLPITSAGLTIGFTKRIF